MMMGTVYRVRVTEHLPVLFLAQARPTVECMLLYTVVVYPFFVHSVLRRPPQVPASPQLNSTCSVLYVSSNPVSTCLVTVTRVMKEARYPGKFGDFEWYLGGERRT